MGKFTSDNAVVMGRKGGKVTVERYGKAYMQEIAKRGFATTVDRHYNGDKMQYINRLVARALRVIDPMPHNGAWQNYNGGLDNG